MSVNQRVADRPAGTLKQALGEAEQHRRRILKQLTQGALFAVMLVIASHYVGGGALPLMVVFGAVVIWGSALAVMRKGYAEAYKASVMPRLLREIDPSLDYQADGGLPREAFEDSHYSPGEICDFHAEDLIRGEVAGRERRICEMRVKRGHGKSKREVFRGLFSETRLECALKGHVVIVPDLAERFFGALGTKLQGLRRDRGQLVHFEDADFEKAFVVYADHEGEARRLLTKRLRKQLLALRARAGHDVGLTVCGDKAYVLVHCPHDHFEPSLFRSALDERPLATFRQDLATVLDVFEAIPLAELA